MMNFLAIDVGNTTLTAGLFPLSNLKPLKTLKISSQESLSRIRAALKKFQSAPPAGVAVASVVPSLDQPLKEILKNMFHQTPLWIHHRTNTGVRILSRKPSEVGADRIVNAAAAHTLFARACVVIDFGTATTFDCVSQRGEYLGGVI